MAAESVKLRRFARRLCGSLTADSWRLLVNAGNMLRCDHSVNRDSYRSPEGVPRVDGCRMRRQEVKPGAVSPQRHSETDKARRGLSMGDGRPHMFRVIKRPGDESFTSEIK